MVRAPSAWSSRLALLACLLLALQGAHAAAAASKVGANTSAVQLQEDEGVPPSPADPPPPPPNDPLSCRHPVPRRVVEGKRRYLSPCQNVAASKKECCQRCSGDPDCQGWFFTAPFDCSHAGLGASVGVCYMLEDVVDTYMAPEGQAFAYSAGWEDWLE